LTYQSYIFLYNNSWAEFGFNMMDMIYLILLIEKQMHGLSCLSNENSPADLLVAATKQSCYRADHDALALAVPGLSRGGGLYGSWKKLYVVASC
jgi:hypothetical protein